MNAGSYEPYQSNVNPKIRTGRSAAHLVRKVDESAECSDVANAVDIGSQSGGQWNSCEP